MFKSLNYRLNYMLYKHAWFERLFVGLILIGIIWIFIAPIMLWVYTQRYIKDSPTTATQGIFLQTTIDLNQYTKLGNGNGLFGLYERYSRSDRHGDVLTIYVKDKDEN